MRSLRTIHKKMSSLKYWYAYLKLNDLKFSDYFTLQEQNGFIKFLDKQINKKRKRTIYVAGKSPYEQGFDPATVNRHKDNIREYYKFLSDRGHIDLSADELPFRVIEGVKSDRKVNTTIPEFNSMAEVRQMIDACNSLRDKLIIVMVVVTGLRVGELCSLTVRTLDFTRHTIRLKRPYLDLETGTIKTGERILKGNKLLFSLIQKYFLLERDRVAKCDNIFVNLASRGGGTVGAPLTPYSVESFFTRLRGKTGIEPCHCHALRHTFSTNFLRVLEKADKSKVSKASMATLQKLLGHSNLNTTMIYTHLDFSDGNVIGQPFEKFMYDNLKNALQ